MLVHQEHIHENSFFDKVHLRDTKAGMVIITAFSALEPAEKEMVKNKTAIQ